MRTADILKNFAVADEATQKLLEAVAETAYAAGQRDASARLLRMATEADARITSLLDPQSDAVTARPLDNIH